MNEKSDIPEGKSKQWRLDDQFSKRILNWNHQDHKQSCGRPYDMRNNIQKKTKTNWMKTTQY